MPLTPSGGSFLPYGFAVKSRTERASVGSDVQADSASVTFIGPYSAARNFANYLMGSSIFTGSSYFARKIGLRHPEWPWLFAQRIEVTKIGVHGVDPATALSSTPLVQMVASYAPYPEGNPQQEEQPGEEGDDPARITVSTEVSGELVTRPGTSFVWVGGDDNGKPLNQSPTISIPHLVLNMTISNWKNPSFDPTSGLMQHWNKINNAQVTIVGKVYATETLRFEGVTDRLEYAVDGSTDKIYEVSFTLRHRKESWNKLHTRTGATRWAYVETPGGQRIHETFTMSGLVPPGLIT